MLDFINSTAPVVMLGEYHEFTIAGDEAERLVESDQKVAQEIRMCCGDLQVLGKKDFKTLLRWRLKIVEQAKAKAEAEREASGADGSAEESSSSESEEEDEEVSEQRLLTEMKSVKDKAQAHVRRDKKKLKGKRMKAKARQIMGGETAVDFVEDMEIFHLKNVKGAGAADDLVNQDGQVCAA